MNNSFYICNILIALYLVIIGLCGIVLIFISSLFGGESKNEKIDTKKQTYTADEYMVTLEKNIKIMYSISIEK